MDVQQVAERVRVALDNLAAAGAADDIAAKLEAECLTGVPGNSGSCVVSEYVRRHVDGFDDSLSVTVAPVVLGGRANLCQSEVIRNETGIVLRLCRVASIPLPTEVDELAGLFDAGRYPELVAPVEGGSVFRMEITFPGMGT